MINGNHSQGSHPYILRSRMQVGYLLGIFTSRDGKHWTRVNESPVQDDLETAISKLALEHAVRSPNSWIKIVDQKTGNTLHDQQPEVPPDELEKFFPPLDDEQRKAKRDEWLQRVLEWCMEEGFRNHAYSIANEGRKERLIRAYFKRKKIEVETHENGSVRVMRSGEPIAEWIT